MSNISHATVELRKFKPTEEPLILYSSPFDPLQEEKREICRGWKMIIFGLFCLLICTITICLLTALCKTSAKIRASCLLTFIAICALTMLYIKKKFPLPQKEIEAKTEQKETPLSSHHS